MRYLLDTNTCIRYLNGRAPNVRARMNKLPIEDVVVCSVVKAELFFGAAKSNTPVQSLAKQQAFLKSMISLPFDDASAAIYGPLRAQLQKLGTPIGPLDLQIAAIALVNNLILVTHNTAEFGRISGLQIEDWELT